MDEPLRILYISHYFPPEVNAPAVRVSEMSSRWAEQGAKVTVLTCFPNHPSGIIPDKYRGLLRVSEKCGAVNIVRTFVYAAPNKGFFRRILNYLSFMVSSILLGQRQIGRPDVVVATSPQFFVAVAGYVISRLKRCRFVFEVRDVWPEEIVAVGALKNRIAVRVLELIEMFLYRKADLIVAVAQGTIDILTRRGISESKIALIPNGVDIDFFQNRRRSNSLRKELGLTGKFIVGYVGTHGMAHRLDIVLEAAARIRDRDDIQFLFVGDGAERQRLIQMAQKMKLGNVTFHQQVERVRIPDFYDVCDVCLVPLKKAELFTRNIPSKIYEIMAAGKPIIISTDGESRKLVEKSGAGIAAKPEDPYDLVDKILHLHSEPQLRETMGHNGLAFALANSSRKRLAGDYLEKLATLCRGDRVEELPKQSVGVTENINGSESEVKISA